MKDPKFNYFKKKVLEHLEQLEESEKEELKKSLAEYESESIEKGGKGLPVGTIKTWKNHKTGKEQKYVKIAPGKWRPKYDSNSRGAKMAIAALRKKADKCKDSNELMQLILENRDRFSDEKGRPLPFVKELSDYVSKLNDDIENKKTENKKKKKAAKTEKTVKERREQNAQARKEVAFEQEEKRLLEMQEKRTPAKTKEEAIEALEKHIEHINSIIPKDETDYEKAVREGKAEAAQSIIQKIKDGDEKTLELFVKEDTSEDTAADEKKESIKRMNDIIDAKAKEYATDSYTKYAAEDRVKRLGKAKLEQYASLQIKSDEEFLQSLKEKVAGLDEEVSEYTLSTAVWNHYVKKYAREWARNKLKSMEQNETDIVEPIEPKDMDEAVNIIGADVKRILDGRDTYGNAKQGLVDKIKRRIRNNPGVARAMLTYIKQEQERSGKKVFTEKHSIWEELPKLNEAARKAHESGESETKTGVTGNLYEGEDGTSIIENKDWGRYQISFPGKPDSDVISTLKRNGFRWSPKTQTWVGYNTSNGEYSMKRVAEYLGLKKTDIQKSFFGDIESSMPYSNEMDEEGNNVADSISDILNEIYARG